MDITEIIERGARNWVDRVAVISGGRKFTFQEVNERANRLANGLLDAGCRPGCHIGVILDNCYQFIEICFAKYKINAVWVTIDPRLGMEELTWQINDAQIDTLVVDEQHLGRVLSIQANLKTVKRYVVTTGAAPGFIPYEQLVSEGSPNCPSIKAEKTDMTRIAYTGGTTGRSKGIIIPLHSDDAVMRNILLDSVPDLNRKDVFLGLQPLYHAVWTYILPCWIRGATQYVTPEWAPQAACEAIQKERVTIIKTVPTVLVRLIGYPELRNYDLRSLRIIIYGGSPMPVEKLKEAIRLFGPIFVGNYGQVEAPQTIATLAKEDHVIDGTAEEVARLASAGKSYTFVEVRVVDDDGSGVVPGEEGEVVVRSDHIMTAYWNQPPEVTAEAIKDGWLYTRDIGRFDSRGYLYLVDRKSEMIITGGLNVYPGEVEQVLYTHPAVQEAAVIGIPDEAWGESIKAFVALKPGMQATEEELIELCRKSLASYKKPKSIEFRESLPKSRVGKILRRELRESFWRGQQRGI